MQGLEFVVSHDPLQPPYSPYPIGVMPSNIWVIKKQRRRKVRGVPDEVTVLGVYFIVGIVVLMAPKIGDVVASRMVRIICWTVMISSVLIRLLAEYHNVTQQVPLHSFHPPKFYTLTGLYLSPSCSQNLKIAR
jgi:hypothetical protein